MKKASLLCLALTVCAGCAAHRGSGVPEGPRAAEYYPLSVGRSWTYKVDLLGEKREMKVAILREENGFFVDSQGGRLRIDSAGVRDQQRYLLQEPLVEGRTWINVLSPSVAEHYKVVSVGRSCRVPAGDFEGCIEVESRTRAAGKAELVNHLTFAPGVGLVTSDVRLESPGRTVPQSRLVLRSFEVPEAATSPDTASAPGQGDAEAPGAGR